MLNHATQILSSRNQLANMINPTGHLIISLQVNNPPSYKGKSLVLTWTTHMSEYFSSVEEYKTLTIMVSYHFEGPQE